MLPDPFDAELAHVCEFFDRLTGPLREDEIPDLVVAWAKKSGMTTAEALRRYKEAGELIGAQYPKIEPESDQGYRLKVGVFKSMMGFKPHKEDPLPPAQPTTPLPMSMARVGESVELEFGKLSAMSLTALQGILRRMEYDGPKPASVESAVEEIMTLRFGENWMRSIEMKGESKQMDPMPFNVLALLESCKSFLVPEQIAEALSVPVSHVMAALTRMAGHGFLRYEKERGYALPEGADMESLLVRIAQVAEDTALLRDRLSLVEATSRENLLSILKAAVALIPQSKDAEGLLSDLQKVGKNTPESSLRPLAARAAKLVPNTVPGRAWLAQVQKVLDETDEPAAIADVRRVLIQNAGHSFSVHQMAMAVGSTDAEALKALSRLVNQGTAQRKAGQGYSLAGEDAKAIQIPAALPRMGKIGDQRTIDYSTVDKERDDYRRRERLGKYGRSWEGLDESLDGWKVRVKGAPAKGLENGVLYTLMAGAKMGSLGSYNFVAKGGKVAARMDGQSVMTWLRKGESGEADGFVAESVEDGIGSHQWEIPLKVGTRVRSVSQTTNGPGGSATGIIVAIEGELYRVRDDTGGEESWARYDIEPEVQPPPGDEFIRLAPLQGESIEEAKDVEVEKYPTRGRESMWLVKQHGLVIGYVTKFPNTNSEQHPHKAYRYEKPQGVKVSGEHVPVDPDKTEFLGTTFKGGLKKAADAVVSGTKLSSDAKESLLPDTLDGYAKVLAEGGISGSALPVVLGEDSLRGDGVLIEDANGINWFSCISGRTGELAWLPEITEAKKAKGFWRTTRGGHRIFIENGKITRGNPHFMKHLGRKPEGVEESIADAKKRGYRDANARDQLTDRVCNACEHFDGDSGNCRKFSFHVEDENGMVCDDFERMTDDAVEEPTVAHARRALLGPRGTVPGMNAFQAVRFLLGNGYTVTKIKALLKKDGWDEYDIGELMGYGKPGKKSVDEEKDWTAHSEAAEAELKRLGVRSAKVRMFIMNKLHMSTDANDFYDAVASGYGRLLAGKLEAFYKKFLPSRFSDESVDPIDELFGFHRKPKPATPVRKPGRYSSWAKKPRSRWQHEDAVIALLKPFAVVQESEEPETEAIEVFRINSRNTPPSTAPGGPNSIMSHDDYRTYVVYDDGVVVREAYRDGRNSRQRVASVPVGQLDQVLTGMKWLAQQYGGGSGRLTDVTALVNETIEPLVQYVSRTSDDAQGDLLLRSIGLNLDGTKIQRETRTYECPKCHEHNAYWRELHADTGMDENVLWCPDCCCDTPADDVPRNESVEEADASAAKKYVASIKNEDKQAYAEAWLRYCEGKDDNPNDAPLDISYMAAQAVRQRLAQFGFEPKGEDVDEVSPPGFEGTVLALKKKHPEIENPWRLAWHLKNKGAKSHYTKKGKKKDESEDFSMPTGPWRCEHGLVFEDDLSWYDHWSNFHRKPAPTSEVQESMQLTAALLGTLLYDIPKGLAKATVAALRQIQQLFKDDEPTQAQKHWKDLPAAQRAEIMQTLRNKHERALPDEVEDVDEIKNEPYDAKSHVERGLARLGADDYKIVLKAYAALKEKFGAKLVLDHRRRLQDGTNIADDIFGALKEAGASQSEVHRLSEYLINLLHGAKVEDVDEGYQHVHWKGSKSLRFVLAMSSAKKKTVQGRTFGGRIGIHMDNNAPGGEWIVSHIPTGFRIGWTRDDMQAVKVAKSLEAQLGDQLDFTDPTQASHEVRLALEAASKRLGANESTDEAIPPSTSYHVVNGEDVIVFDGSKRDATAEFKKLGGREKGYYLAFSMSLTKGAPFPRTGRKEEAIYGSLDEFMDWPTAVGVIAGLAGAAVLGPGILKAVHLIQGYLAKDNRMAASKNWNALPPKDRAKVLALAHKRRMAGTKPDPYVPGDESVEELTTSATVGGFQAGGFAPESDDDEIAAMADEFLKLGRARKLGNTSDKTKSRYDVLSMSLSRRAPALHARVKEQVERADEGDDSDYWHPDDDRESDDAFAHGGAGGGPPLKSKYALRKKDKPKNQGQDGSIKDVQGSERVESEAVGESTEIAKTILKQLGGSKFIAMTGAKNFVGSESTLSFRIGRNDSGVNAVRITLRDDDLYEMVFQSIRGRTTKTKQSVGEIGAEQLRDVFTKHTGMQTSLGTMGETRLVLVHESQLERFTEIARDFKLSGETKLVPVEKRPGCYIVHLEGADASAGDAIEDRLQPVQA